jgi:membrane AbrB-like protein
LETAVIGGAGSLALGLLHIPAGPLVGAMVTVAIASLAGRPTSLPAPLQAVLFMVVGASVGAAVTPEALGSILGWPASLGILIVTTLVMYLVGYWVFRRFGNCDPVTAFFAAAPGALSSVVILAEEEGAVMSRVAAAQALRVACITAASPFLLTAFHLHPSPVSASTAHQGWLAWALLIASTPVGWQVAARLKWPSPAFLGPMAMSAALHAGGLLHLSPPRILVVLASAGLGALVGTRFRGVDPKRLLGFFPPAAASFLAMGVIGLFAGWAAGRISGVGPVAGMLAFAPGSMDVLIAISLASSQAPAYVAAHHTARLLAVLAALPWVGPRLKRPSG